MIEWSWRIERSDAIIAGSWSPDELIDSTVGALKGLRIQAIALVNRLPEVQIALTGDRWVHSFMTAEGDPEWTVFLPDGSWITTEKGQAIHDIQNLGSPL